MKKQKCYIAGRISGLDYADVLLKFVKAYKMLRRKTNYTPINPVFLCNYHWSWVRCMARCLWALAGCRAVYLLPDWNESRGARIEVAVAVLLGKKIITEL